MSVVSEYAWVDAAPFAAHVRRVCASTGIGWRVVAAVAEVPTRTVARMMSGQLRRIPESMARRLLGVDAVLLTKLERRIVGAAPTAALIERLRRCGVSWGEIADAIRLSHFEVRSLLRAQECPAMVALEVTALADERGVLFIESRGLAA